MSEERPAGEHGAALATKVASAGPWLLGIGGVTAVTGLATWIAVADDRRGELSLGLLRSVVKGAGAAGEWLLQNPQPWLTRGGAVVAMLALSIGLLRWLRERGGNAAEAAPLMVALGLALIAELLIFHGFNLGGAIGYAAAVAVIVFAHLTSWRSGRRHALDGVVPPPGYPEATVFLAIGTIAVFFRYYALNRVLDDFEGELACYMAGATDLHGMLLANIGSDGPWAPLGLLYYLPIWAMVKAGGSTVLAVRLGSAVIGILTVITVYVVVRDAVGRTASLWSAALLAVDTLQVGWGRSDMHPHASTAWPGVLLFGATVRALTTGALGWYLAIMLLMGLSWHQYPSGQFVVIIPVIAFAVHGLQTPGFFKASWRRGLLIVGGSLLWILGYPLAVLLTIGKLVGPMEYIARLGPRVLGGSDVVNYAGLPIVELLSTVSRNLWDLTKGLFADAPFVFHQTLIPNVEGLTPRALPWFVAACAVVGLTVCCLRIRERWAPSLIALMVAGILPAVLSDTVWLKRASLLYLALIIVAAVPLAIVTDDLSRRLHVRVRWLGAASLAAGFLLWSCIWAHLWFSGYNYSYGVSAEETISEALDPHLAPDTLVIFALWGDYIEGELVYLVSDAFKQRQPMALYVTDHRSVEWPILLAEPTVALSTIKPYLWYWSWLGLDDTIPEVVQHRGWSRVVYLIQHRPGVAADFEMLADHCPDLEIEGIFAGHDAEERDGITLKRYHVWIAHCDQHRDLERLGLGQGTPSQSSRTR